MRHKVDGLTRTVLTFAAAMIGLVIIAFFASSASAQDAIDVQQDLDIATVNSKAEDARGKAIGVEGRLTTAEGTIANHGSEVSALATGQASLNTQLGNVDARVSALETAPGANQAQVDSNTSRIAALESQPAPSVTKYVARDYNGVEVHSWYDQAAVGPAFIWVADIGKYLAANITPNGVFWTGVMLPGVKSGDNDGPLVFPSKADCLAGTNPWIRVPAYNGSQIPTDQGFFGGFVTGVVLNDMLYELNARTAYELPGEIWQPDCVNRSRLAGNWLVYVYEYRGMVPSFQAPITVAPE